MENLVAKFEGSLGSTKHWLSGAGPERLSAVSQVVSSHVCPREDGRKMRRAKKADKCGQCILNVMVAQLKVIV